MADRPIFGEKRLPTRVAPPPTQRSQTAKKGWQAKGGTGGGLGSAPRWRRRDRGGLAADLAVIVAPHDGCLHDGPLNGSARDRQCPAEPFCPLTHPLETEVTFIGPTLPPDDEAAAVVGDAEVDSPIPTVGDEDDLDLCRGAVTEGVVNRLLTATLTGRPWIMRPVASRKRSSAITGPCPSARPRSRQQLQSAHEGHGVHVLGSQLEDIAAPLDDAHLP